MANRRCWTRRRARSDAAPGIFARGIASDDGGRARSGAGRSSDLARNRAQDSRANAGAASGWPRGRGLSHGHATGFARSSRCRARCGSRRAGHATRSSAPHSLRAGSSSKCTHRRDTKDEYLLRPDLGRHFDDESRGGNQKRCLRRTAIFRSPSATACPFPPLRHRCPRCCHCFYEVRRSAAGSVRPHVRDSSLPGRHPERDRRAAESARRGAADRRAPRPRHCGEPVRVHGLSPRARTPTRTAI